jgi:hypothetical protein
LYGAILAGGLFDSVTLSIVALGSPRPQTRILFREFSSENDGKAGLVELNATPEWATVGKAILVPASVPVLNGDEIRQHGASVIDLSGPQKRQTRFDTIARPRPDDWYRWNFPTACSGWRRSNRDTYGLDAL